MRTGKEVATQRTVDDVGVAVDTVSGVVLRVLGDVLLPELGVVLDALVYATVSLGDHVLKQAHTSVSIDMASQSYDIRF